MTDLDIKLTADDVLSLLAALRGIEPPLLVGGQALNILARHYRVEGFQEQYSRDVDFVGDKEEAQAVAEAWHAEISLPTMDDNTPNTAILTVPQAGRAPLTVDFLENVAGAVFGSEIPFLIIREGNLNLRVLHPLSCLQSRLWNIYGPLARRDAREIERAHLAINVLRAHITSLLDGGKARAALNVIERMVKYTALSRIGDRAWVHDRIDVLESVPLKHRALPENFRVRRWPAIKKSVERSREMAARTQKPRAASQPAQGPKT